MIMTKSVNSQEDRQPNRNILRVLVTGGAGFIGSNFVRYCRRERPDWELLVVDVLTYAGNLDSISDTLDNNKVTFSRTDICDRAAVTKLLEGCQAAGSPIDTIIHFAAESHVDRSIHSAEAFIRTNVLGTENLLSAARAQGVSRFLHISTDEVYGSLGAEGRFYEETPLDPTSPYAASKASSDLVALAYAKTYGMDVSVTRCTNNYGPYQFPEKFIPLFILNAIANEPLPLYGDGRNVRSWLHVDDHCEAVLRVTERGGLGEVYNIGAKEDGELPNIEVATAILNLLGRPTSLIKLVTDRLAHDRRYAVATNKITEELGWLPQVPFREGLAATVAWYQTRKDWCDRVRGGEYLSYYDRHYSTLARVK